MASAAAAAAAAQRYSVATAAAGAGDGVVLRDATEEVVAVIHPNGGAEVAGFCWRGHELVDQALRVDGDTAVDSGGGGGTRWHGRGQVLFPAVGRQRDGGRVAWPDGRASVMPLHGVAKDCAFAVTAMGADEEGGAWLTCELSHTHLPPAAAAAYPFAFTLRIEFRLARGCLIAAHTVMNEASAGVSLPFAIGNHLTLRYPLVPRVDAAWADGRLRSPWLTHELALAPGSLLSGDVVPTPAFASLDGLPLTAPAATNGVFARLPVPVPPPACALELVQPGAVTVRVTQTLLPPPAAPAESDHWQRVADARYFVLWGDPAPDGGGYPGFICLEPWLTGPDSLNTPAVLPLLPPGTSATWTFTLAATAP